MNLKYAEWLPLNSEIIDCVTWKEVGGKYFSKKALLEFNNGKHEKVLSVLEHHFINTNTDSNCSKKMVEYITTILDDVSESFANQCKKHSFTQLQLRLWGEAEGPAKTFLQWHSDNISGYRLSVALDGAPTRFCIDGIYSGHNFDELDKYCDSNDGYHIVQPKHGQGALFHGVQGIHSRPLDDGNRRALLLATIKCDQY